MANISLPATEAAMKERLQVAAIDFGTTYSGYAFSFRGDFVVDPLKIHTNKWEIKQGSTTMVSLKAPSCVLFNPDKTFHSFGFDAENHYTKLAEDGESYKKWYFYKRFKMKLYENKDITRTMDLPDDKGLMMPAIKVFSECIRYLKEHLLSTAEGKDIGIKKNEVHWVLTVPAIWDDAAKQFMREAAVEAGIASDYLSLALEPEAASLYCRHLPVEKVEGSDGTTTISNLAPGKKYLVLDAGGGTVDITVHETQEDGTLREVYKANGGPWGGTTVDEAFLSFLEDVAGKDVVKEFEKTFKEDYLTMFRDFEIKKKTFDNEMDPKIKITFRVPVQIHELYKRMKGMDFRRSLLMKQDLKDQVTFTGDKLRVFPKQVHDIFDKTCGQIVKHLTGILSKPVVQGTETILMVGGFSESKMLQIAVRKAFPDKRVIIPLDAGLAVLKGAVIFGHNPSAIISRISKYTYGIQIYENFDPEKHDPAKKVTIDGRDKCDKVFDKHVEIHQEIPIGTATEEKEYWPVSLTGTKIDNKIFISTERNPKYTDGLQKIGHLLVDLSAIPNHSDRNIKVQMIYGNTELGLVVKKVKTGEVMQASFDFL